ncbi:MAG: DUF4012 domain-containing protein [Mycobacteriales bacterium]|nr:DUF4012 domain-containing protein [Frankia sp.]
MSPRRVLKSALLFCAVAVVAAGCWCAVRGYLVRGHVAIARTQLARLESAVRNGDAAAAQRRLDSVQQQTAAARSLTSDVVWRLAGLVPRVGATFTTTRGLAAVADDVAQSALPSLLDAGVELAPRQLRVRGDTVSVERLQRAQAPLRSGLAALARALATTRSLPRRNVITAVRRARAEAVADLERLVSSAQTASLVADVGPGLVGADRPRRYFVAIQNNAEARATGGLVGAFAILEAAHGRLRLVQVGSTRDLRDTYPVPAVNLGADFTRRYRRFGADSTWRDSNMSPHFPSAAAVWMALWKHQTGQQLDGALAVDPVAMSAILRVTGSVRVAKQLVATSANVVAMTESAVYALTSDDEVRDRFLQVVARKLFDKFVSGSGDPVRLVRALAASAGTNHIQLAVVDPAAQRRLAATPVGGVLPSDNGPFFELVTQDAGGSKLDYYLRRAIRYDLGAARRDGTREATIVVRVRNTAPRSGLPAYVTTRADLPAGRAPVSGQTLTYVSAYCGAGATLLNATLDGRRVLLESHIERRHSVFSRFVTVDPGKEVVLRLHVLEPPGGPRQPTLRTQPLVAPDDVAVSAR